MATTDTNIKQIVFNRLSKAKYEELKAAGSLNANEFYITPDESVTTDELTEQLAKKQDSLSEAQLAAVNSGITSDKVTAYDGYEASIAANATAVADEKTRAEAAEATLTSSLADEVTRAKAAEEAASKAASDEATRAKAAEATLTSDLAAEVTRAKAAEESLDSAKADKATTLAGYGIADAYTKTEIDGKLTGAMHYKGTVAAVADLDAITDAEVGDVYNVTATGDNYAWDGTVWDKLSGVVDLSGKQDKLTTEQLAAVNSGITASKVSTYDGYATGKQDTLTEAQLAAVNSGITSDKVATYDGYADTLAGKQDTLTTDQLAAVNSGITAAKVATYDGYATSISDEVARAKAAEEANATNITANATAISEETTRAKAAEEANATNIAANTIAIEAEATRAKAAEATLTSDLAAEVTRAKAAEADLQTAIDEKVVAVIRTWE